jgi:hypothetical protein
MKYRNMDMFHDKAAHDLEARFVFLAAMAGVIWLIYRLLYP